MKLRVLSVAYPFAPVGPDAVGGAEQILTHLDAALVRAGHDSLVLARSDSLVRGKLIDGPIVDGSLTDDACRQVRRWFKDRLAELVASKAVDMVHLHGVDFLDYLPPAGPPVLVTLHLPLSWYPREIFQLRRPGTYLQCVSKSQRSTAPPEATFLCEIENGVAAAHIDGGEAPARPFVLALGRICPEKGFHLALDAAKLADVDLVLGGAVFAYPAHEEYFRREIEHRLDERRRFVGPVGGERKSRLLASARCLLLPSLVQETSSLVAMEALAHGAPVIAFRAGALAEIVEHGRTGFLVDDVNGMAEAIGLVNRLERATCRRTAQRRFSLERMTGEYLRLYRQLRQCTQERA